MNGRSSAPAQMILIGFFATVVAGGLAVQHVGRMERENAGIKHGFSFRSGGGEAGAAGPVSAEGGFVSDFKRGVSVVAGRAGETAGGLLDWLGMRPSASRGAASASVSGPADYGDSGGDSGAFDPFAEFYSKFYGPDGAQGGASADIAAGESFSGSGGSATGASHKTHSASADVPAEVKGGGAISLGAAEASRPVFGGPSAKARQNTTRVASVSMNTPLQKSVPPPPGGGSSVSAPAQGRSPGGHTGNGLSGFNNKGAAGPGDLNDSASGLRSEAMGKYNSAAALGASGVASAAAAAGGGRTPQASGPERVQSASGGSGSGGSGSGQSSSSGSPSPAASDPSGDKSFEKSAPGGDDFGPGSFSRGGDTSFLGSVVAERQNRDEGKYLQQEDYKAQPDLSLLKSGAMPETGAESGSGNQAAKDTSDLPDAGGEKGAPGERQFGPRGEDGCYRGGHRPYHNRPPRPPDPESFAELSDERKLQIRQRIHRFMRRFENRYGMMQDVTYTSCERGAEVCGKHEITQGYITEVTRSDASLVLGLKYHKQRWRPYVVSVTLPDGEVWERPSHDRCARQ